jgi:hypothetical protein
MLLRICGFRENRFREFSTLLVAVNKLHLIVCRENLRRFVSKEHVGTVCLLRHRILILSEMLCPASLGCVSDHSITRHDKFWRDVTRTEEIESLSGISCICASIDPNKVDHRSRVTGQLARILRL